MLLSMLGIPRTGRNLYSSIPQSRLITTDISSETKQAPIYPQLSQSKTGDG